VSDRYIDLEAIKEDIQKTPRQSYPYRPLSSMGFLDDPRDSNRHLEVPE
jgi:hypothetical protein